MSNETVIRRVAASFVPVAVNLYQVREAQDAGGALFRSVQRQKDQYQGIWIVAPDGRVLAGHHNIKNHATWSQEVLDTMDAALKAFGDVPPRNVQPSDVLPYRGKGVAPNGRVTLAVYTRYLHDGRRDGPTVLDSIALRADEWAALFPRELAPGARWTLPEGIARKFSRVLSPSSDQSTMPRPEEVIDVRIEGVVQRVDETKVHLRFAGEIAAEHRSEARVSHARMKLTGQGIFDAQSGQMQVLRWVFDGVHRAPPPYDAPRQAGAVVEWTAAPADDPASRSQ